MTIQASQTAFTCTRCGSPVEALNPLVYRLLLGGKQALCGECVSGPVAKNGKEEYTAYLKSEQWRARAFVCKQRAGNLCRLCNSPDNLEAHHRTYINRGSEMVGDLTCLCRDCHSLFHEHRELRRE